MQRDGKDHGNGIDRNGLNEVGGVHGAIVSKSCELGALLQAQQGNIAQALTHHFNAVA